MPDWPRFPCLACGYLNYLRDPPTGATYFICEICKWEDGGEDPNRGLFEPEYIRRWLKGDLPYDYETMRPPRPAEIPPDGGPLLLHNLKDVRGWAEAALWAGESSDRSLSERLTELSALDAEGRDPEGWISYLDETPLMLEAQRAGYAEGLTGALTRLQEAIARTRASAAGVPDAANETPIWMVLRRPGEARAPREQLVEAIEELLWSTGDGLNALEAAGVPDSVRWGATKDEEEDAIAWVLIRLDETRPRELDPEPDDVDDEATRAVLAGLVPIVDEWLARAKADDPPLGDPRVVGALEDVRAKAVRLQRLLAGDP